MNEETPKDYATTLAAEIAAVQASIADWQTRADRARHVLNEATAQVERQSGYLQGLERALAVIKS